MAYLDYDGLTYYDGKVKEKLNTKANVDGYYINLTSGNAEQLISNVSETEQNPYTFRASGGSLEIGDRETDKLVGMSLPWNQIVLPFSSNYWSANGATLTRSDDVISFTASQQYGRIQSRVDGTNGTHVYFCTADVKISSGVAEFNCFGHYERTTITGAFQTLAMLVKEPTLGNIAYYPRVVDMRESGWDAIQAKNINIIDLTIMFGSTIADYILSLEQSTAGAGVAWFRRYFPKAYYAYNTDEMLHTKFSAHKMVGFNQWDEEWELGTISPSTGENASSSSKIRSKDFIPVLPNITYHFHADSVQTDTDYWYFYDSNKQFVSSQAFTHYDTIDINFTTPSNARYMKFIVKDTTYRGGICINFHYDGERDGEYEPYEEYNYPLDSDLVLRGIPKIDAEGNLYADGDTYESDGTVTRRFGIVTLDGTQADNQFGVTVLSGFTQVAWVGYNSIGIKNAEFMCDRFTPIPSTSGTLGTIYPSAAAPRMYFGLPTTVTTASEANAWFASNPTTIVYPLAESTTETADPYTNPQVVDNWGTEEYVVPTQATDVEIPVGHETQYPVNLRSKIEVQPNAPVADGTYVVKCESGTLTYIPLITPTELPIAPSTDGTYSLKVTVASGTTTYAWVAE